MSVSFSFTLHACGRNASEPAKMGLVPFRQPSTLFCCCHLVLHMFCCIVENKLLSLLLQLTSRFVSRCGNDSDRRREPKQTRLGATFDHFHVHRPRNSCPRHRVASRRCRTHLFRQDLHRYNYSGRRRGNQPA